MKYEPELIRFQLLEAIKRCYNEDNGAYLNQINSIMYDNYKGNATPELRRMFLEELFHMISEGIVLPHMIVSDTESKVHWHSYSLTAYGMELLSNKAEHPYFIEEYINRVKAIIPDGWALDTVIEFYVRESVELNRIGRYTPSVVMLGVASERAIDMLCEAVMESLNSGSREKFRKAMEGRSIKVKIDEVRKKIEAAMLPGDLSDGLGHIIWGFVTILRKHRNEFGHPSAVFASKDDAMSYLKCFPQYLKRIYLLVDFYQRNTRGKAEVSS